MASAIDSLPVDSPATKTNSDDSSEHDSKREDDRQSMTNLPLAIETKPKHCDTMANGIAVQSEQVVVSDGQSMSNVIASPADDSETPSNPYNDYSGIDTESFITTTLRQNRKDRTLLLSLEKLFQDFIHNEERRSHQFQAMNSYERMIVHRVAAFFGLDHNVDKNGQSIVVTKTANTRIPPLAFQTYIPADELSNIATSAFNSTPVEAITRYPQRRNDRPVNHAAVPSSKQPFERPARHSEPRDKPSNVPFNKFNRKQQQQQQHRFNSSHYGHQPNLQPSSHVINTRAQLMYSPGSSPYHSHPRPLNANSKQQANPTSSMYNFVPMMSSAPFQPGTGMPVPILLHQQPTGQIQYVFPTQQPQSLSSDGQYLPIYRSDMLQPVVDNIPYAAPSLVHLYPAQPYPGVPQTAYLPRAASFMIPPTGQTPIQFATNQLSTLNLQSLHDDSRYPPAANSYKPVAPLSANGAARMPVYHHYRHNRAANVHPTDKQFTSIENDLTSATNGNSAAAIEHKD